VALTRALAPFALLPEVVPPSWGFDRTRRVLANMHGDYSYLGDGYYASLDAEFASDQVIPTTREALDALVVPIALLCAERAGLPVPAWEIVTDRFPPPPVLAYPVNPFSVRGELLGDRAAIESRRKGLTYTSKYAVLCQRLPADHRIDQIKVVLGRTVTPEYRDFAGRLFEAFRLPLMRVRTIVTPQAYLLSAIEPLPLKTLKAEERALMEGMGTWLD
jgi:hypothetical protein